MILSTLGPVSASLIRFRILERDSPPPNPEELWRLREVPEVLGVYEFLRNLLTSEYSYIAETGVEPIAKKVDRVKKQ